MRQRSLEGFFPPRAAKRAKSSAARGQGDPTAEKVGALESQCAAVTKDPGGERDGLSASPPAACDGAGSGAAALAPRVGEVSPPDVKASGREGALPVALLPSLPDSSSELLSLLTSPSWRAALSGEFSKPYFVELETFLAREWSRGSAIFPPKPLVFNALNSCPLERVRVVILGQDPYHGPGQAMGLSFSVPRGVPVPSSLRNIHKELLDDINLPRPGHGSLQAWADRGVLLLNAVLTVRSGQPNSHANKGWERFTDAVIRAVAERAVRKGDLGTAADDAAAAEPANEGLTQAVANEGDGESTRRAEDAEGADGAEGAATRPKAPQPPSPHVIFMLWGRYAQKKGEVIRAIARRAPSRILVLEAAHPSGLSASRGFFGCRHFSKANCWLRDRGEGYIDWRYD